MPGLLRDLAGMACCCEVQPLLADCPLNADGCPQTLSMSLVDHVVQFGISVCSPSFSIPLLDAFRTMLPKAGATWKLGVSRPHAEETTLSGDCVRNISTLKERLRQQQAVEQTNKGPLAAMDVKALKSPRLYPQKKRVLE